MVWPSGAALATSSVAMMLPAPGLASTITCWPQVSVIFWPMMRARKSPPLLAEEPTMKWFALAGYACARASPVCMANHANAAAAMSACSLVTHCASRTAAAVVNESAWPESCLDYNAASFHRVNRARIKASPSSTLSSGRSDQACRRVEPVSTRPSALDFRLAPGRRALVDPYDTNRDLKWLQ